MVEVLFFYHDISYYIIWCSVKCISPAAVRYYLIYLWCTWLCGYIDGYSGRGNAVFRTNISNKSRFEKINFPAKWSLNRKTFDHSALFKFIVENCNFRRVYYIICFTRKWNSFRIFTLLLSVFYFEKIEFRTKLSIRPFARTLCYSVFVVLYRLRPLKNYCLPINDDWI